MQEDFPAMSIFHCRGQHAKAICDNSAKQVVQWAEWHGVAEAKLTETCNYVGCDG